MDEPLKAIFLDNKIKPDPDQREKVIFTFFIDFWIKIVNVRSVFQNLCEIELAKDRSDSSHDLRMLFILKFNPIKNFRDFIYPFS